MMLPRRTYRLLAPTMPESLATLETRADDNVRVPPSDGRLPIVIGVTGHRALRAEDEVAIAAQLQPLLRRLRRDCPDSPLVVLSALAEGADRVIARSAVDAGAHMIAVLPLPMEDYRQDFGSAQSCTEFEALLADARTDRCVILPVLDPAAREPGDARNLQYLLCGLYIARQCDVLVAVWDGSGARGTGGTAQVVTFKQTGRLDLAASVRDALAIAPAPYCVIDAPLDAPQPGLVYHVAASRPDDATPRTVKGAWLVPPAHAATSVARDEYVAHTLATLRHRDAFNGEAAYARAHHAERLDDARAMLTRGGAVPPALDDMRETFAAADLLALMHQQSIYRMLLALFLLVGVATVSLLMRNLAITEQARRLYLAGYLLLLAVADLAYLRTRWRKSQDRFQDYRALAEGLRVQFFWRLAGAPQAAADYYLRKQRSELRWIRDALRVAALQSSLPRGGDVEAVQRLWVDEQRDYFHRAAARDGRRRRGQRTVGSALVLLSLSATVAWLAGISRDAPVYIAIATFAGLVLAAHCAYEIVVALREADSGDHDALRDMLATAALSVAIATAIYAALVFGGPLLAQRVSALAIGTSSIDWMLAAIGITALAGTFAHAYANVRAFGEHEKQYGRMEALFRIATDAITQESTVDETTRHVDRVILDLGCEALAEHADWLLLHRARPIELPTAEL